MRTSAGSHFAASTQNAIHPPDPPNEVTRRALGALHAGRIAEALICLQQLPKETPSERAWSSYVLGRILMKQGEFVRARVVAQQAASAALGVGLSSPTNPAFCRLAAAALEMQGAALRRQDHPEEARRIHLAAFNLRNEYGIGEEQCESAMSLGSCAEWIGDLTAADQWYRSALSFNLQSARQAEQKSGAFIRLSHLLTKLSRHDEAVEAATSARELLNNQMPGELVTLAAGLHSAHALVRQAEHRLANDLQAGLSALTQAASLLERTHEGLSAFGKEANIDLKWCEEQIDSVERLRRTFNADSNNEKQA